MSAVNTQSLPATDPQGFLVDRSEWTREVAQIMAASDEIQLTEQHWEIIEFLRSYHEEYGLIPIMRVLCKAIGNRLGDYKGKSRYLYRLFPEGPVRQGCRYAGLPKPPHCI
jgi:tRNA 2-thiouridine synthesizing protein E